MKVLVSGYGADRDSIDEARRITAYRRLVLLASHADAPELLTLQANEELCGVNVEVHRVDPADFYACLRAAIRVLQTYPTTETRVHVGGGPNLLTSALLLAAFQEGKEAFYCHPRGVSRLPVALDVRLQDRLAPEERSVLLALDPTRELTLDEITVTGITGPAIKRALLRLRKSGLVHATHERASLTSTGTYYRNHLLRAPSVNS